MTPRVLHNAHKMAYFVQQYPEKKMTEVLALFQLPPVDINAAIWAAIDLGLISDPDKETNIAKFLKVPDDGWDFGEDVQHLIDMIYYCMEKLNARGDDMEENYMSNWTLGYTSQDTMIAMRRLIENKQLAQYELEDGENAYDFFTLYENREQLFGRKQFKQDPLATRKNSKKGE